MKQATVRMVRVYLLETNPLLKKVISYLHDDAKIRGLTVFRAVEGFGDSGNHNSQFVDLSLDLPLVIEFFDNIATIENALETISQWLAPEHIVYWDVHTNS